MRSVLKEDAAQITGKHSASLRLRGKGPPWFGLVLLVLAVDLVLAAAAWNAVDFFRN